MFRSLGPLAALIFVCPLSAEDTKAITKAERVLAIYTEDWSLGGGPPELIFAAWGDGQIVWSHDRKNGGAPFSSAKIRRSAIGNTLKRFKEAGLFRSPALKEVHFGPDSKFTTILIRDGEDQLKMQSWHEQYDSGPSLAATSGGIEVLDGRILLDVLAEEPSRYLLYRLVWSDIRLAAVDLIPASGTATNGTFKMRRGEASWITNHEVETSR